VIPDPPSPDEFLAMPTIRSQFPLVFDNGARWDSMTGTCWRCDSTLPDVRMRGSIDRPFGATFMMEAWGLCDCGAMTHYRYRIPPDMTLVGKQDGRWCVWARPPDPWWRRLLQHLGLAL